MSTVFALFLPEAVRLGRWTTVGDALGNRDTEILATLPLVLRADDAAIPGASGRPATAPGLDQSVALLLRARRPDIDPGERLAALARAAGLPVVILPEHGGPFLPPGAVAAMNARDADRATDFADLAALRPYVGLRDEPNQVDLLMRTLHRILAVLCHDARLAPSAAASVALEAAGHARAEAATAVGAAARETAARGLGRLRPLIAAMPEPERRVFAGDPHPCLAALVANRRALRRLAMRLTDPGSLDPWDADAVIRTLVENDVFLDRWERHRLSILCGFFRS